MNIPKEAIKKAIEGGWTDELMKANPRADIDALLEFEKNFPAIWQVLALDPLFWQALGKSLGWSGSVEFRTTRFNTMSDMLDQHSYDGRWVVQETYFWYAFRFQFLVFSNGDTDDYWKEILK